MEKLGKVLWLIPLVGIFYCLFCCAKPKYWFMNTSKSFTVALIGLFVQIVSEVIVLALIAS